LQSGSQRGRVKRLPPAAQQLGKNDAHVAQTLHNLALLYRNSGQLDKAAAPYERSRGIWRAKEAWGLLAVSFKDSAVLCDLQVVKPPPPPSRTKWTRLVPPPVLIGYVSRLPGALHTSRIPCVGRAARCKAPMGAWSPRAAARAGAARGGSPDAGARGARDRESPRRDPRAGRSAGRAPRAPRRTAALLDACHA
jgi:hypothetical protein